MKKKLDTKFSLALGLGILALVLGVGIFAVKANAWIAVSIIILGIIFVLLAVYLYRHQGKKHEVDYRTLFNMGLIFFVIGLTTSNPGMWGLGLAFFAIGLVNRKKWKKEKKWSELTKKERKVRIVLLVALGLLVIAGLVAFLLVNYRIIA
jgi:cytochrome c biogenesis protein CcdA